jgi:hypothetical protein
LQASGDLYEPFAFPSFDNAADLRELFVRDWLFAPRADFLGKMKMLLRKGSWEKRETYS